jgi:hypothetical protein
MSAIFASPQYFHQQQKPRWLSSGKVERNGFRPCQPLLFSIETTFPELVFDRGRNSLRGFFVRCASRATLSMSGKRSPVVPDSASLTSIDFEGHGFWLRMSARGPRQRPTSHGHSACPSWLRHSNCHKPARPSCTPIHGLNVWSVHSILLFSAISRKTQSFGPHSDAGEEVALSVSDEIGRLNKSNVAFIYVPWRDVSRGDQVAEPPCCVGSWLQNNRCRRTRSPGNIVPQSMTVGLRGAPSTFSMT